ncbi:hypothetical protein WJX73_002609 [Symbiochloris irregularis]|uniref:BZIP domain-containing protein n=1 Tax=Symbiochloris irregularis TaxID=706552 RepID=A0AAW1P045_9CHLO
MAEPMADDHSTVLFFKHPTSVRMRNREAQARYRSRQKHKHMEQEQKMQEVEEARKALQAETKAFNAQRQAWQAIMQICEQQQQAASSINSLQPDLSLAPLRGDDTMQSAILRTAGHPNHIPAEILEVQYSIDSCVHRVCGLPQPTRDDVLRFRLDSLFERKKLHMQAISKLLAQCTDRDNKAAHKALSDLMHNFSLGCRLLDWSSMSSGNSAASVVDAEFTKSGLREFGLPSAEHWKRAVASLNLSKQQLSTIMQMRGEWHQSRRRARQQVTDLPSTIQAYVSEQPGSNISHQQLEECHVRLQRCRQEEHKAACKFTFGVRNLVLTPIQNAKLLLLSWPYKMDMEAILNALCGEPVSGPPSLETYRVRHIAACTAAPRVLLWH